MKDNMKLPTMNGNNIIMFPMHTLSDIFQFVSANEIAQFSVSPVFDNDDTSGVIQSFILSTPITVSLEDKIPGVLHGARCRMSDSIPDGSDDGDKPTPPRGPQGPNPKGPTPPDGGSPGTPVLDTYTITEAKAA